MSTVHTAPSYGMQHHPSTVLTACASFRPFTVQPWLHIAICSVVFGVVPGIALVRSLAQVPSYRSVAATCLKPKDQQAIDVATQ